MSVELELVSGDKFPKTPPPPQPPPPPPQTRTRTNPCIDSVRGDMSHRSREILYVVIYSLFEIGYMLTTNNINLYAYGLMCVTILGNSLLIVFALSCLRDGTQIQKYKFYCVFACINCINIGQLFFMFSQNKASPVEVTQSTFGSLCINLIWMLSTISILVANMISVFWILFGFILSLYWCKDKIDLKRERKLHPPLLA